MHDGNIDKKVDWELVGLDQETIYLTSRVLGREYASGVPPRRLGASS
jgi:hypothetical protein